MTVNNAYENKIMSTQDLLITNKDNLNANLYI